jgi:hypothetical protein
MAEEKNTEPAVCKVVRVYGPTTKLEEPNWCDTCNKSSMQIASVYLLTESGVTSRGTVVWCRYGKNYVYTNLDGVVTERIDHKQVEYQ